ncbi:MAG: hypothetical protein CO031_02070 [Candidatus Nealsonbacteria bacterium CG_4_9_14_0_2_um_filter_37_38]|nr:MAG: hypothetical protein CO031_02070 [Candidatus Nealsonbacteria bacterium CG_4_9_14_0_2_um_filter_37_38]
MRGVGPQDWDVATNAKPTEIGKIFPRSYADNKFGTVTILTGSEDPKLKEIEITPYRIESKYTDKRHPDEIKWAKTIKEDLARRDFTVNAIAMSLSEPGTAKPGIIDPFKGQKDIKNKIIRAVGNPEDRFSEDALRMMRAVRFAVTLQVPPSGGRSASWRIETKTGQAIKKAAPLLQVISKERIRDELMKIVMVEEAASGLELLRKLGLLKYIIPELEEGYGQTQNKHHIYEIYDHNLRCLDYAAKKKYNKFVRLAALFHDLAKPRTKRGEGPDSTFYGHEILGAKMTCQVLNRLKFSKKDIEKIAKLVRYHLFYYNVGEVSEASVRRLVRQVELENVAELLQLRYCDRIGSGCPKAEPYKLRHLKYLIEKVSQDPISVKMLEVNGKDVMDTLEIQPGPAIGQILDILLGQVLSYPQRNKKNVLLQEIKKLGKLNEKELRSLSQKAREERERLKMKKDEMTKKKYWVT